MKRLVPVVVVVLAVYLYQGLQQRDIMTAPGAVPVGPMAEPVLVDGGQVEGVGTVIRVLPDDNDGSRHQRFILQLESGRTLLVAHNIDLAPRINSIRQGDSVAFFGEFRTNPQGGVIHWTHHDPQKRHPDGWLKHGGRIYQ